MSPTSDQVITQEVTTLSHHPKRLSFSGRIAKRKNTDTYDELELTKVLANRWNVEIKIVDPTI